MIDQTATAIAVAELMQQKGFSRRKMAQLLHTSYSNLGMKLRGLRRWTEEDLETLTSLGLNSFTLGQSTSEMTQHTYEVQLAETIHYLANHLASVVMANPSYSVNHRASTRQIANALATLPGYLA